MFDKATVRVSLIAAALCGAHVVSDPFPALAQGIGAPVTRAVAPADAQTSAIFNATNAFLSTLSNQQRAAVLFDFRDADQRARWSNLPEGIFKRKGMAWGDMSEAQHTALMGLLGAVLGPEGVENVRKQMEADEVLRVQDSSPGNPSLGNTALGNRPPVGPRVKFGSDYYYVSFLGSPSTTSPWMVQFGGHHLGINATVVGSNVTLSPTLTGGQPVKFTRSGEAIHIAEQEVDQARSLLNSLTDAQREKAVIGTHFIDLVLGPGKDGMTLQPEGLPGTEMTDTQKARLLALIDARLSIIMNAGLRAAKMAEVRANLDQTYFAWSGPTEPSAAAYWRVTGPAVLLEFSPQSLGGDPSNHLHNMYRDPTNEYGAAWTALK
jgi:Protein of unknown function (DUF3500)